MLEAWCCLVVVVFAWWTSLEWEGVFASGIPGTGVGAEAG